MLNTVGVMSILEGPPLDEARRLWKLFEAEYASRGVQSFDHPNLTFQGGRCCDVEALAETLAHACRQLAPFEVIVDGLGYFEAPAQTVFLKVQLTEELQRINRVVNAALCETCEHVFEHYLPERWTPHVTVAMGDLTPDNFARARQDLSEYHLNCRLVIRNLQLVQSDEPSGRIEIVKDYQLGGDRQP